MIWALLIALYLTGSVTTGEATYYHPSLEGSLMRDETPYIPENPNIVAVAVDGRGNPVVPLGTWLLVCRVGAEKCIVAEVRDTGLFPPTDLDLSFAGFSALAEPGQDRIKVMWQTFKG